MKKSLISLLLAFILVQPVFSQAAVSPELAEIQREWAHIKYQLPEQERDEAYTRLAERSHELSAKTHDAAALVWEAIIKASLAGERGAFGGALTLVDEARQLLEEAERIDPNTLDGSVYTTLGSLYYQVPGWPLGFGDDEKALAYLKKALEMNPDGIDTNYFYGDYLMEKGEYKAAAEAFEKALRAKPRPNRPVADQGRRKEIEAALKKARAYLKKDSGFGF